MLLTYGFTYCIFSDLNCGCLYRDSNYGQCRLPIFDVPSEIQKKVKKKKTEKRRSEQKQRCQNETEWMGFVWLSGSVKSLGRTCCRPADQHNDAVIERCPIFQHASQKLHAQRMDRVFTRYWRRAGKMRYKTLHVITRSDASTMHLGAKVFAYTQTCVPTTGRLGAYCHDWRVTHSSARCTFDRLGLGRWRWGLEEVLGRENRKQRKTKPSALCVLNRTQKSSNPAKSESSIQRRWHRKMQNVPEKEEACEETKEGCIHLSIDFQLFCLC